MNALAQAGFTIEQMVEQTDKETMKSAGDISTNRKKPR